MLMVSLIVFLFVIGLFIALIATIVPLVIEQVTTIVEDWDQVVEDVANSDLVAWISSMAGGTTWIEDSIAFAGDWLGDPKNIGALTGGILAVGAGIAGGLTGATIVLILTRAEELVERRVGREEPLEGGDALGGPLVEPRLVDRDRGRVSALGHQATSTSTVA